MVLGGFLDASSPESCDAKLALVVDVDRDSFALEERERIMQSLAIFIRGGELWTLAGTGTK